MEKSDSFNFFLRIYSRDLCSIAFLKKTMVEIFNLRASLCIQKIMKFVIEIVLNRYCHFILKSVDIDKCILRNFIHES